MTSLDSSSSPSTAGSRHITAIFAGLLVSMLLSSLDQTIFSTALPTIVGELNGVDHMLWVTTAYILAATIMMPVYGKLGDLIGRKPLFIGALSIFIVGSVVGGMATSMPLLIAARAIQGVGGGGLMILAQAIIADVVPVRERGRYMGVMGAVFGVSAVAGPLLGGWFTESIGWRWAFWLNIPLGLVAIALAWRFLPMTRHANRPAIDTAGFVTMAISVTSLILVTSLGGNTWAWSSPEIIGLSIVAIVAGIAFVWVESRAAEPLIPLHLFRDRNFNLATIAGLVIAIAMFGAIGYMPTYLQMVHGFTATEAGFLTLPMVFGLMVTAMGTGQIASRTGRYKWMPIAGGVVMSIGLLLLSTLEASTSIWIVCAYLMVLGAGIGFGMQILVLIVQNAFPGREVGTATAANNFFREIGASLGSAVVGSMFTARLTSLLIERMPADAAGAVSENSLTPAVVRSLPAPIRDAIASSYNDALTPVFLFLVPLTLATIVILFFVKEKPLAQTLDTDPEGDTAVPAMDGPENQLVPAGSH
ncbi:MAG: MDR family MFS transporter [Thermomicrobiales bacterium]